jgi:prepilin-type N-terminal cleavage/methylation domain-containing protein
MKTRHRSRGFTLIELMIVVVIIGVLSVLAVTGWSKHIIAARAAEATNLLGSIRAAEETYFQAFGQYCGTVNPVPWPAARPTNKTDWGSPANATWTQLGLRSPGQVWFQYFLAAGGGNVLPPAGAPFLQQDKDGRPWYWAWGENNFHGGPNEQFFEVTSRTTEVFEGERGDSPNN